MKDKEKHIEFGVQECSKCKYKLRCEECVYNEKDISELIKFEKQQERKETAEKILFKFESAFAYYDNEDMFSKKAIFECLEEIVKSLGVEIKE